MLSNLDIKMVVEDVTGISDIGIRSRKLEYVTARFVYYALSKKYLGKRFRTSATGRMINRDHSSVVYGLGQFDIFKEQPNEPHLYIFKICEIKLQQNYIEARILPPPVCRKSKFNIVK